MNAPQPHRKTYRRPDLGIVRAANELAKRASEIELGWLELKSHLRDAGWPARTPEGDRKPARIEPAEQAEPGVGIDYSDTTGDQATGQASAWHRDLEALQDAREAIESATKDLKRIAAKYRPDPARGEIPICSVPSCSDEVERRVSPHTGKVTYRGMEQIAGIHVAQVGCAPTCARHGRAERRENAA